MTWSASPTDLKGSVGNFAAKPAFAAAFRLGKNRPSGDFEQVPQAVDALEHEIQRLQAALEEWAHKPARNDREGLPLPRPLPPRLRIPVRPEPASLLSTRSMPV